MCHRSHAGFEGAATAAERGERALDVGRLGTPPRRRTSAPAGLQQAGLRRETRQCGDMSVGHLRGSTGKRRRCHGLGGTFLRRAGTASPRCVGAATPAPPDVTLACSRWTIRIGRGGGGCWHANSTGGVAVICAMRREHPGGGRHYCACAMRTAWPAAGSTSCCADFPATVQARASA